MSNLPKAITNIQATVSTSIVVLVHSLSAGLIRWTNSQEWPNARKKSWPCKQMISVKRRMLQNPLKILIHPLSKSLIFKMFLFIFLIVCLFFMESHYAVILLPHCLSLPSSWDNRHMLFKVGQESNPSHMASACLVTASISTHFHVWD